MKMKSFEATNKSKREREREREMETHRDKMRYVSVLQVRCRLVGGSCLGRFFGVSLCVSVALEKYGRYFRSRVVIVGFHG